MSETAKPQPHGTTPLEINTGPTVADHVPFHDNHRAASAYAAVAGIATLSACGSGEEPPAAALPPDATAGNITDAEAARFLLQAQFSASTSEIAEVKRVGYTNWLTEQMARPVGEKAWDWLSERGYATIDTNTRYYDNSYPGDYALWYQLITHTDAVRKRCALALSEFFVVSLTALEFSWRSHAIAHYWDQLNAEAFGNFRQLLENITLNPAMGVFLNTRGNQKENTATGRLPDENYAREVMQLFSIGLSQLNADGTVKTDPQGKALESYTQEDVTQLARVFTGYDFDRTGNIEVFDPLQNRKIGNHLFTRLPMTLDTTKHQPPSTTSKHSSLPAAFLGVVIPANTPGASALKTAMDTLFNHPNVGPFFGRQMIQRLVTGNPSPAYVARVTAAFNDNGRGVRGDLAAVFKAVLTDSEARSPSTLGNPTYGKVREPMVRFIQWARTFPVKSTYGTWKIGNLSNSASQLGQSPLRAGSVFNFFRPGYVPPNTALATAQATAPEFQLVNETTVAGFLNYMQGVIRNGLYINAPELPNSGTTANNGHDIKPDYSAELALVLDPAALVSRLNLLLAANQLGSASISQITTAISSITVTSSSSESVKLNRIAAAVLLVMASHEYTIQK
jgi:uncharacterized protein (DUF1800 family)